LHLLVLIGAHFCLLKKKLKNEWNKKEYNAVGGKYSLYLRKEGCPYYSQFLSYLDSDVIIFNGEQYILETEIGRKPATDVEIIDECDEFLDNFALEGTINLTRLKNELSNTIANEGSERKLIEALSDEVSDILNESLIGLNEKDNIKNLDSSKMAGLIKTFIKSDILDIAGDESYIEHCFEVARKFYDIISESHVNFYRDENKKEVYAKLVTINLDKLLSSLIAKNKSFVFMSGTLHSERILKEIFGLKQFKIIDAETFNQGTIKKLTTGLEKDFKFENFKTNFVSREDYLKALDRCVEIAKIPIVVQVSAFQDLPSEIELEKYKLKNLISSTQLIDIQNNDRDGKMVNDFKSGKNKILFTTRCNRGIDFPFEVCNSVVITKFPYPNTQSLFWRILNKNKPAIFWEFYKDKAHRELLQRIYRSVRAVDDSVFLLSPDIRVLNSKLFD
jgi:Rad3-related DNA helicase